MIEELTNCLTKYATKKFLNDYQWNDIFTNSKDNICCALEDCDSEILRSVKILFGDDNIEVLVAKQFEALEEVVI